MARRKGEWNSRRIRYTSIFIISIVLILWMLWTIVSSLGSSSQATFSRGSCSSSVNGRKWGRFNLCRTDKPNSCDDGCTCVPFREEFKFGRCVSSAELTPSPSPSPTVAPGSKACGEVCQTDADCSTGYCHDPNWQACPTETPEPITPTCVPRPKCLDSNPRCLPPEPIGGFCPPNITPTVIPSRIPKPTHACGVRGSALGASTVVTTVKTCRDRTCFAGEQCACPVPSITLVPVTPTVAPDTTVTPAPACTPPVCDGQEEMLKCDDPNGCPDRCNVKCENVRGKKKPSESNNDNNNQFQYIWRRGN